MWKSRLLANRSARASALSTATMVTSTPSAATPFSDNSRASIAAVSELAECLDFMFDRVNYEGRCIPRTREQGLDVLELTCTRCLAEPGDLLHLHLERLNKEAARYENSRLEDDEGEIWDWSDIYYR